MQLDLQYIVAAVKALHAAAESIRCGTPEQRGVAAAHCITAAIDLEVRIGNVSVDVCDLHAIQTVGGVQ